jgi:chromosome segregation ATPase
MEDDFMENSDKMYGLLEKIYIQLQDNTKRLDNLERSQTEMRTDITGIKGHVSVLKDDVSELKDDVSELKSDVRIIGAKIDGEITDKIRALYDARAVMNDRFDTMDEKIDKLQIDVNGLTAKTAFNDNRIIEMSRDLKRVR